MPRVRKKCDKETFKKTQSRNSPRIGGSAKQSQCLKCGLKMNLKALPRHMRTHSLQKPYQCKWCDYSSIRKQHLQQHLATHTGEKAYHCKECGRSFGRAESLKRHLLVHSGEKPYKCTNCDYSGALAQNLRVHMTRHIKN